MPFALVEAQPAKPGLKYRILADLHERQYAMSHKERAMFWGCFLCEAFYVNGALVVRVDVHCACHSHVLYPSGQRRSFPLPGPLLGP